MLFINCLGRLSTTARATIKPGGSQQFTSLRDVKANSEEKKKVCPPHPSLSLNSGALLTCEQQMCVPLGPVSGTSPALASRSGG